MLKDCIALFTAKTGCETTKNKHCLQTLESIPKLAVGRHVIALLPYYKLCHHR